jgi:nitrogen fixation/metabolism regulation signal transduction histidine kinase
LALLVFGSLTVGGFLFIKTDIYKFLLIECIAILAIIFFVVLYIRLIKPYQIISSGMDLIKEQDFSSRLRLIANSEANKLIEIFNKMMEQLRDERLQVREKNRFLDLLIKASPQGVIILDFDNNISEINPAGLRLLNISDINLVKGKQIRDSGIPIAEALASIHSDEDAIIRGMGIVMYRCSRSSFLDRGFAHPFILIEELTHELLKTEKKSYEGVIRMMAHEVNNSVAAISSTLNVISDILKQDEENKLNDVLPAVDASFDRCRHLSSFISNFSEVVKIPKPMLSVVKINDLAHSVEALTVIELQKRNIRMHLELSPDQPEENLDRIQLEQVLVNIVKNAYEAIEENGDIKIATHSAPLSISISNNGPEISDEVMQKLFTPFFTTKSSGQGIGLMFVREVLLNHSFKFDLKTKDGWTTFNIFFGDKRS